MHPELFSLGPISIKTYGAFMALGFYCAWQVLSWLCRKNGREVEPVSNLLILMMVSGIVGSRIAYVIEHWNKEFAANPMSIIRVDQGGLMFYGGLILAIFVFVVWCIWKKEKIVPLADLFVTVIPLGHAFGRIGCFFFGCCYGKVSKSTCAIVFPRGSPAWHEQVSGGIIPYTASGSLPVLPTQLFEATAVFALFGLLFFLYRKYAVKIPGFVTGVYLTGYALIRFGLEFLRGDPRAAVGAFSIGQTISSFILISGLVFIAVAFRQKKM
jgi:phosphatidylglycerol:prolipoprotein diacylglycerol transferase